MLALTNHIRSFFKKDIANIININYLCKLLNNLQDKYERRAPCARFKYSALCLKVDNFKFQRCVSAGTFGGFFLGGGGEISPIRSLQNADYIHIFTLYNVC